MRSQGRSTRFQVRLFLPCAAVVYDMNGREASDVEPVLDAVGDIEQYIFCSSAGVYLKSDQLPHREEDATDPKSRHKVCACCLSGALVASTAGRQPGTERPLVCLSASFWVQHECMEYTWLLRHCILCEKLALRTEGLSR